MKLTDDQKLLLTGAAIAALALWYLKKKTVETAKEAAQAINPTNPQNIINQGFTSVYQSIMGEGRSLGSDLYDWLN